VTIADRVEEIRIKIRNIAVAAGRDPNLVRLVAVSKTRPAADIIECLSTGQEVFGENYVQELVQKAAQVQSPLEWHFIGHLQSNKVRSIAGMVTLIHSVDRLSLAEEISRQWGKLGTSCNILLQVNLSGEKTKSGTTEEGAIKLARDVSQLPNVKVKGLMTMPPFFDDPEEARPYFAELKRLSQQIEFEQIPNIEMKELSMGMSGDFEAAIQEGATLVRVGTAIFGTR